MINRLIFVMTIILFFVADISAMNNVIFPEVPTTVELSNHDINRIVCPGTMNDLIFSEEKGLTGHFSGNNAFMKFKIEDSGGEYIYASEPSELFVVCDNIVYSLITIPKEIPTVTLRLSSPKGNTIKKNIGHYKNLPLEKQVLQIIREAYDGTYPSSYRITELNQQIDLTSDLQITLIQAVNVDGVGLGLKSLRVMSLVSEVIEVEEAIFLDPVVSDAILAVAVVDHRLQPGEVTMVFVVEKKEEENGS